MQTELYITPRNVLFLNYSSMTPLRSRTVWLKNLIREASPSKIRLFDPELPNDKSAEILENIKTVLDYDNIDIVNTTHCSGTYNILETCKAYVDENVAEDTTIIFVTELYTQDEYERARFTPHASLVALDITELPQYYES